MMQKRKVFISFASIILQTAKPDMDDKTKYVGYAFLILFFIGNYWLAGIQLFTEMGPEDFFFLPPETHYDQLPTWGIYAGASTYVIATITFLFLGKKRRSQ